MHHLLEKHTERLSSSGPSCRFLQESRNKKDPSAPQSSPLYRVSGRVLLIADCVCACVLRRPPPTHPMYCSGWLWWITILHVGHVLFSSRYFTRQLLQTADRHSGHKPLEHASSITISSLWTWNSSEVLHLNDEVFLKTYSCFSFG